MRRVFSVALLACWLLAVPVHAGRLTLSWNASEGAAGYQIYESLDYGQTWTPIADLNNPPLLTSAVIQATEGQLVLSRVSAYNVNGEAFQYIAGAWYNSAWLPSTPAVLPALATQGLGVQ